MGYHGCELDFEQRFHSVVVITFALHAKGRGFEPRWNLILIFQINKEADLIELYTLLNENYVEDDDNMFRFDYSCEFLKWALTPPGWHTDWHCAVRNCVLIRHFVSYENRTTRP